MFKDLPEGTTHCNMEDERRNRETCIWEFDERYDYYETSCGEAFVLENNDGNLEENKIFYCFNCGKRIKEVEKEIEEDEEDE